MKSKHFQYQGSFKVPDEETFYHQTILFCVIDNVTLARLVWLLAYQLSSNGNIKKKIVLLSISTVTTAREKNEVFVIPDIKMI